MSGFYQDLMAATMELLLPDEQGGLGQGNVTLTRTAPGVADQSQPWVPVEPITTTETLRAAVFGAQEYADGVTVLETDLRVIAAVPSMPWRMNAGDGATMTINVDGRDIAVVRARGIPDAGIQAAVEFIIRE